MNLRGTARFFTLTQLACLLTVVIVVVFFCLVGLLYKRTQGNLDGGDSVSERWLPSPVFALIRKDYKYTFWPNEQIFHVEMDQYGENDISSIFSSQSNPEMLEELKLRYAYLKQPRVNI